MPTVPAVTGQNPYDSILAQQEQELAQPTVIPDQDLGQGFRTSDLPQAPGTIVNPYDKVFEEQARRTETLARMSALDSSGKDAEQYAEYIRLGQEIGLPVQAVENDPEQARQIQRLNRWGQMAQQSPQVAAWLATADHAVLAQDDLEALSGLDKVLRGAGDAGINLFGGVNVMLGAGVSGVGDTYDAMTVGVQNVLRGIGAPESMLMQDGPTQMGQEGWWMNPANWFRAVGDPIKELGESAVPEERQNFGTDVTGGLGQLIGQYVAQRINPFFGMTLFAGQGAEQQATRAEEAGADAQQRATAVAFGATITAATEKLGLDILLERLPPAIKNRTVSWMVDKALAGGIEGTQEGVEQVANNLVAQMVYDPNAPLLEGLGDSASVGAAVGVIARTMLGIRMRDSHVQQAKSEKTTLDSLVDLAGQTKLRELAPDKFRDLIGKLSGEENANVYVDADEFNRLYQSKGMNPEAVAAEFGVDADAYRIATVSSGEIAIPIASYLTKVDKADHSALAEHAKMTAGGLTPAEAQMSEEIIARQADIMRAGIQAEIAGDNRIRDDVVGMMLSRYTRDVAEQYGTLTQAMFKSLADRQGLDAFELYSRYSLRIKNELPGLKNAMPVDTYLDPLIERLRAGEIPTEAQARGPSLVEALVAKGGITDEGMAGEIRSIAESDRAARRGKAKLVRGDAKLTLDGALELAVEAGYLPQGAEINDLIEALTNELVTDRPTFAPQNENSRALTDRMTLLALDEELGRRGIDIKAMSNAEIKKALADNATTAIEAMYDQVGPVGSASFERWFRQSKVVDERGRPLIVYHGTGEEFSIFDKMRLSRATGHATSALGFYFTPDEAGAQVYADKASNYVPADAVVLEVYLSIQNPYTMTLEEAQEIKDTAEAAGIRWWLQQQGYDGIWIPEQNAWVAFESNQIKSVRNRGTYSLEDNNIYHQSDPGQAAEQTQTAQFKAWSEGAPLVERQEADRHAYKTGEPFVVRALHGTPDGRFMQTDGIFKGQREKFGMQSDGSDRAFWFSTSDATAKTYADPTRAFDYQNAEPAIIDGFVKMMNPLIIDGGGQDWRSAQQRGRSSDVIRQARDGGHDGVVITNVRDDYNNTKRTKPTTTFVVFSSNQIKSATNNDGSFDLGDPSTLSQSLDGSGKRGPEPVRRGSISGFKSRQFTITLLENADASTFIHELGHFGLEVMGDLAQQPDADPQLVSDFRTLIAFGGADPDKWASMSLSEREDAHERIARGFEAYIREGKSPSAEMAGPFERLARWMMKVYRDIRQLNVTLTDEVRGVFDRMLASDAEIQRAEADMDYAPIFKEAAAAGMTEAQFQSYVDLMNEATREARDALTAKAVNDVYREREAWWKEESEAVRAEVEEEVNRSPLYRAWYYLAFGKQPNGEPLPEGMEPAKLDKGWLVGQYGQEWIKKNLLRKRVYAVDGGADPDLIASMFGFESGDAMVQALANAEPKARYVKAEVDRRMRERHGDMVTDGTIEAEAIKAVHNNKRLKAMEAEMATLARLANEPKGTSAQIRRIAESMVARMKLRDIKPNAYLRAERKHAREAQRFAASGNWAKALEAKRKQVLNAHLYDVSLKASEEGEKIRDYAKKFEKVKLRERLGKVGRLQEVDALLDAYDLRRVSGAQIDRQKAQGELLKLIESGALLAPPAVVQRMRLDGTRTNYRELTMENLRGLRDILRQLEVEARNEYEALLYGEKVDLDQKADEIAAAILASGQQVDPQLGDEAPAETVRRYGRKALGAWLRPSVIARLLDGSDNGPITRLIIQPVRDAVSRVLEPMKIKANEDLAALYSKHYTTKEMAAMNERRTIPGLPQPMSRWDLISIALNWGNEQNRKAVLDSVVAGRKPYTQAGIEQALSTMTARDWAFVQDSWDYLETYWPKIKESQERRRGIAPPKVEPLAFTVQTADGQAVNMQGGRTMSLAGGYYPLRYNGALDARAKQYEIDDFFERMKAGTLSAVQSKYGHNQERVGSGGQPVLLSMNVMHQHVNNVIHDIALGDVVNLVDRLLKRQQVRDALVTTGNMETLEALRLWLKDTATGELAARNGVDKAVQFLRLGFTKSKIGFNVMTALMGVTGFAQTSAVVGSRWVKDGAFDYLKDPRQAIAQVMDQSDFMRLRYELNTFNKDVAAVREAFRTAAPITKSGGFLNGVIVAFQKSQVPPAFVDAAFWMIRSIQMQVDTVTWLAGYHKAKAQGMGHADAVRYSDGIVENAQTSGLFSDRSGIERGTLDETRRQVEFVKIWTTLGSYMIAKGNIAFESYKRTDFRNPAQALSFAGDMGLLFFVEAILIAAIKGAWPEDDESWWWWTTRTGLEQMAGTIPIVRELPAAIRGFGAGGGPVGAFIGDVGKVATQTSQAEMDAALIKAYVNMIGTLTGAPSAQTNKAIDAYWRENVEGEDVSSVEYVLGKRQPPQ